MMTYCIFNKDSFLSAAPITIDHYPKAEAPGAVGIGAAGISMLGLVGLLCVIIDLLTVNKHAKYLFTNLKHFKQRFLMKMYPHSHLKKREDNQHRTLHRTHTEIINLDCDDLFANEWDVDDISLGGDANNMLTREQEINMDTLSTVMLPSRVENNVTNITNVYIVKQNDSAHNNPSVLTSDSTKPTEQPAITMGDLNIVSTKTLKDVEVESNSSTEIKTSVALNDSLNASIISAASIMPAAESMNEKGIVVTHSAMTRNIVIKQDGTNLKQEWEHDTFTSKTVPHLKHNILDISDEIEVLEHNIEDPNLTRSLEQIADDERDTHNILTWLDDETRKGNKMTIEKFWIKIKKFGIKPNIFMRRLRNRSYIAFRSVRKGLSKTMRRWRNTVSMTDENLGDILSDPDDVFYQRMYGSKFVAATCDDVEPATSNGQEFNIGNGLSTNALFGVDDISNIDLGTSDIISRDDSGSTKNAVIPPVPSASSYATSELNTIDDVSINDVWHPSGQKVSFGQKESLHFDDNSLGFTLASLVDLDDKFMEQQNYQNEILQNSFAESENLESLHVIHELQDHDTESRTQSEHLISELIHQADLTQLAAFVREDTPIAHSGGGHQNMHTKDLLDDNLEYCNLSELEFKKENLSLRDNTRSEQYMLPKREETDENGGAILDGSVSVLDLSTDSNAYEYYTSDNSIAFSVHTYETLRFTSSDNSESGLLQAKHVRKKNIRQKFLPKYQLLELDSRYLRALHKHSRFHYSHFK